MPTQLYIAGYNMIPVPSLNNQPILSISDLQLLACYLNKVQRKERMGRKERGGGGGGGERDDLNELAILLT